MKEQKDCQVNKAYHNKNIFDGASAAQKGGNYFGPLAGANGMMCQHRTNIENVSIMVHILGTEEASASSVHNVQKT